MSAKPLHLMLTLALWLVVAITMLSALVALSLPLLDEPLLTSWQVQLATTTEAKVLLNNGQSALLLQPEQGTLLLETRAYSLALSRALTILLIGSMVAATIFYLKRLVTAITAGRPFSQHSSHALQKAGYLLVALPVMLFLEQIVRFYLFVPDASDNSEFGFISLRLLSGSGTDLLIYPAFNIGLFAVGCFVLVIARAFIIGNELQTDSDEII